MTPVALQLVTPREDFALRLARQSATESLHLALEFLGVADLQHALHQTRSALESLETLQTLSNGQSDLRPPTSDLLPTNDPQPRDTRPSTLDTPAT